MNANTILQSHYDALVVLLNRMDEGEAKERVRTRATEAMRAMRGMPDDVIMLGELHTAYRAVVDHGPTTAKFVGSAIQSSDVRGGNALRQLEEKGLVVCNDNGEWVATDISPDGVFSSLTTVDKRSNTRKPRNSAPQPKEAAMAANTNTNTEFTIDKSKVTGTKFEQVVKMIDLLRKSDTPIPFTVTNGKGLCELVGAKYPQDVQAAMFALETIGTIDRYKYVEEGSTRERIAYKWNGDEARPTQSTSTASKPRSRRSKKVEATTEATPAAA